MNNKVIDINTVETVLEETLEYSRKRNYVGWDKHDGMSSQIRRRLPFEHKWTNLAFQETIKRAPINLRPLFLVEQRPNPKGLSLFAIANLNAYTLFGCNHYLSESQRLCERILSHDLNGVDGFCLSHHHELQGLSGKKPTRTPNIVSTSFGVKALLQSDGISKKYPERAHKSADFITSELLSDDQKQARISYTPEKSDSYTLNANALAARLFIDLYDYFDDDEYREIATGILTYVANCQEEIGGWEYKDPPSASHLGMDNYHNGFILESFLRYQEVVDADAYAETVKDGLNFYRYILYDDDGAPCWDETSAYPRDIHAAAQGIVTFTHAGNFKFARRIIDWTIDNLYARNGQFYYQKQKHYTKRFTLMRWCQAWMAYSLSEYLNFN
ncbi:antibiotic ABC transporter permease [Natronococcus pandeyae]|uniref:Antibiotic ABC transporter permease n=1 Tax=Natronococcus pandeyae TaxID=2055836 RepID=A0A8J8Q0L0_9EURY|nr:antibiotic ABC transporter permease [Natronococcus pandeyae]TYL37231.1 antibiotic ABC transporter permease [Natronococcus pandeyae]